MELKVRICLVSQSDSIIYWSIQQQLEVSLDIQTVCVNFIINLSQQLRYKPTWYYVSLQIQTMSVKVIMEYVSNRLLYANTSITVGRCY